MAQPKTRPLSTSPHDTDPCDLCGLSLMEHLIYFDPADVPPGAQHGQWAGLDLDFKGAYCPVTV